MPSPLPSRHSLLTTAFRMAVGMTASLGMLRADILRGGGATQNPQAVTPPSGSTTPAEVIQARANARDSLARTSQAIAAVRQMQLDARQQAAGGQSAGLHPTTGLPLPAVPNGLGASGLAIDPRVATDPRWWQGASLPTQTQGDGRTQVTIVQNAQQALLNWENFNVGSNTTLTFDQSAGGASIRQWIAFNKVNDPSGNPTQILGSIQAGGQVYVINRNGVIFGGSSQVNVGALTASALPINDNLVANGLLNNSNREFLFNGVDGGSNGNVTVQSGARISTSISADGNGGRVALIGARVQNSGTISTSAGQTILAAGLQVAFAAHSAGDPSLRGLDTYVGAVTDPASTLDPLAGTAINSGIIESPRGSVTITGRNVQQLGIIESTTAVDLNGRVDLLADYGAVGNSRYTDDGLNGNPFLFSRSGQVMLGGDSVIRILPEGSSSARVPGSTLALRSQVNLRGRTIHLAPHSSILAPNAIANLQAGRWVSTSSVPYSTFIADGGQIYLDQDSSINLAGTTDATASVLQNYIDLVLRGSELAVAPLQREGELRGQIITIDASRSGTYNGTSWVGTPLADVSGFVALIERDVSQLTTAGGSLQLSAGGSVVVRNRASLNVSGGWTQFTGATVSTTRVVSNGQIVDIADATPDQIYSGIYTTSSTVDHSKWGVTESFVRALAPVGTRYQEGYIQGADAGSITISAPSQAIDGNLIGLSISGPNQTRATATTSNPPALGSLTIRLQAQLLSNGSIFTHYPGRPSIILEKDDTTDTPADFELDATGEPLPLATSRQDEIHLDPALFSQNGFGRLTLINPEGDILLPATSELTRAVGGSIDFRAANINILGDITAPGGTLSFTSFNLSPYLASLLAEDSPIPLPTPGLGGFRLGSEASLVTRGLVSDDRQSLSSGPVRPLALHGGSVSITALDVSLASGSIIDVSGGLVMTSAGSATFGRGGTISIKAGQDPNVAPLLGGRLDLGASFLGYSGSQGGTLAIQAPGIQLGGQAANDRTLGIDPGFFNEGGFSHFHLTGLGTGSGPAVKVVSGTQVAPVVKRFRLDPNASGPLRLDVVTDPVGVREAASIRLSAPGVRDLSGGSLVVRGEILVEENSVIATDPGGSIQISGNTVGIHGTLMAPAGSITVAGGTSSGLVFNDFTQARATTVLGSAAVLSATGTTVLLPDPFGRRIGNVLAGGHITLGGNIAASSGARIDVSGSSGILDLDPAAAFPSATALIPATSGITGPITPLATVPVTVDSAGGTITLQGGQMLASDATLLARSGGAAAAGGTLIVSSGRLNPPGIIPPASTINLTVHQSGSSLGGQNAVIGAAVRNDGLFTIDDFADGGFSSLTLGGVVNFEGPVAISAPSYLRIATDGFLYANDSVSLNAGAIALGQNPKNPEIPEETTRPFGSGDFRPAQGNGRIVANAGLIEFGSLSLQQVQQAVFNATGGDIRGSGTVHLAGDLTLTAGQIHPLTATDLSFIAYDHATQGSITVESSGSRQLPLSAAGNLGLYASNIRHAGTLRAPFGTIRLGWDGTGTAPFDPIAGASLAIPITRTLTLASGSITSVSGFDPATGSGITVPYGVSTDSENWIDPRGVDITNAGPPLKQVVLSGASVVTEEGSNIDLRGGGDLYAYRWVEGIGGPIDVLDTNHRFAILPAYSSTFAPVSARNNSTSEANLIDGIDNGYTNSTLKPGDKIYVAGSKTLAAGWYTLLPARYALLPGGILVSPAEGGNALGTVEMPDGSSTVSGFISNRLDGNQGFSTLASRFELAASGIVRQRARYDNFLANSFFKAVATTNATTPPRLPIDSGHLVFQASEAMSLLGQVASRSTNTGRAASIDISTALRTMIGRSGTPATAGSIILDSDALTGFDAESLLIGGRRTFNVDGTSTVTVTGSTITVDNTGSELSASDLILAARNGITLESGSSLTSSGPGRAPDALRLSGDGTLVRVTAQPGASVTRNGASGTQAASLTLRSGSSITGGGLVLDSTSILEIDPTATILADSYSLSSGRITLALDSSLPLPSNAGLVLGNNSLDRFAEADSVSLVSYSSIDLLGSGRIGSNRIGRLSLSAGNIRGTETGNGSATITARELTLRNTASVTPSSLPTTNTGRLVIEADSIELAENRIAISGFSTTTLRANRGITGAGEGTVDFAGNLELIAPVITGEAGARRAINVGGHLELINPGPSAAALSGGLGSSLTVTANSIRSGGDIRLPSGRIALQAASGNVEIRGTLDVAGVARVFSDVTGYTSGGSIRIGSTTGSVLISPTSKIDISSRPQGGSAGTLDVSAPLGSVSFEGTILASGGTGGTNGSLSLDVAQLPRWSAYANAIAAASLNEGLAVRVRQGNVEIDESIRARNLTLTADRGGILVNSRIDASGVTGGTIHLAAHRDLFLADGSTLTVAASQFDAAGKGGSITLEAGTQLDGIVGPGTLSLQSGSTVDLGVSSRVDGSATTPGTSAYLGRLSGKLHLRAPRLGTDLAVAPLDGTILGASSILVEGYRLYDLTSSGGLITTTTQNQIKADGESFLGAPGLPNSNQATISSRLISTQPGLSNLLVLTPGAEIINRNGDVTLGSLNSTSAADWDLSGFRFGPRSAPGVLTIRASGDLVFHNALSDGFAPTLASTDPNWLWLARLSTYNLNLPANLQSWTYRLAAGADLSSASFGTTVSPALLASGKGNLLLGKNASNLATASGSSATTQSAIANRFQVIRTGSGDISVHAANDVRFLNQFATVYTAGTRVADAGLDNTFRLPSLSLTGLPLSLGNAQQTYAAQYSMAGGNVSIEAGNDIGRYTLSGNSLVADSQFQMPTNWLYRRGYVDPVTGTFGDNRWGESASTTWWIDFSNFFQGVGALGGGNVALKAGNDIANIDAVVPTNARMPGYVDSARTANARPSGSALIELGGGNIQVRAGGDIDAGVYYVERGQGSLSAGGSIHTNPTRSVLAPANILAGQASSYTELPTTLFLGKGGFQVSANGSVLLGPVANPFLLPSGLLNSFWHKSYFSTYGSDSHVSVSSLGGDITLRTASTQPGQTAGSAIPLLQSWYANKLLFNSLTASHRKPWLRLSETSVLPFETAFTLQAARLATTAFSGNVNLVGDITLTPSATGDLTILASGSVLALQPNGVTTINGLPTTTWGNSTVNVSDADPSTIFGISSPFGFQTIAGTSSSAGITGDILFLESLNRLFRESGATLGQNTLLQVKQALHAAGPLHKDNERPLRVLADSGDISGLRLFSPKFSRIIAGRDLSDIALYLQNARLHDVSIVAGGRDLTLYAPGTPYRNAAQAAGNIVNFDSAPQAGDIQISGPGTLQVIAGRQLDLGTGSALPDGTATGISSIGNTRNPFLSPTGANLVVSAGIGPASGLTASSIDFAEFIEDYVLTPEGRAYLREIDPGIAFENESPENQARLALGVFFRILRDAGRNYPTTGNYDRAFEAITLLFGPDQTLGSGEILTRSRDIRTTRGGDIAIVNPAGGLTLAESTIGNPLSPPGIITESGGEISIFARKDIDIGIGRIFTLRGGNEILWSSKGDIAAGSSSKTVQSAPPTRVLIDPQSAAVQTDLSGLATGGGIGVLATVAGVKPGNVDLIAPEGTVDAGDAGIRVTGNLNIAANQVLNTANISVGGNSAGTPSAPSAPALASVTPTPTNLSQSTGPDVQETRPEEDLEPETEIPTVESEITVEVLGYGGSEEADDEDEEDEQEEPESDQELNQATEEE